MARTGAAFLSKATSDTIPKKRTGSSFLSAATKNQILAQQTQKSIAAQNSSTEQQTDFQNNGGPLGGIGYLGEKLAVGFMSSVEGIWDYSAGGFAKLFGADDWAEEQFENDWFGDWYSHPEQWYNPSEGWQVAGDIAGGIGTSLPAMLAATGAVALTVATAGAAAPVSAAVLSGVAGGTAAITAGLGAAGNATKQAYRETGKLTGEEFGYGALSGLTEGSIEGLSSALSLGTGQIVNSIAKSFGKQTAKTVAKQGVVKTLTKGFVGEAFEEGFSEFLDPYWQRATYNPNAQNATPQEIAYASFVGGMSGMLMGGAGSAYSAGSNLIKGHSLSTRGLEGEVLGLSEQLSEFEKANNTGDETFQSLSSTYDALRQSLESTGGKVTTAAQKRMLGELQKTNTIAVFKPIVLKSATNIVNNAEAVAARLNAYGYTTADGKPITFTAEQIREGIDANDPSSFSKALKKNAVLRELAVIDATGRIVLDTAKFAKSALAGQRLASQVDLNRFLETATPSEIAAVSEALGIEDWSTLDAEAFNERITTFVEDGGVQRYADMQTATQQIQSIPAESARPMPKMINLKADGTVRYSDGNVNIAVTRSGDSYTIYDYATGFSSKPMTRAQINKRLRDYNTKKTDILAEAKAEAEKHSALKKQAEELDAYAREHIPDYAKLSAPNQSMIRKVLREARANGISPEYALLYAKVSAHTGVDVVFNKARALIGTSDGSKVYADGFYSPSQNVIVVNPEGTRSPGKLLIHELAHAIYRGKDGVLIAEREVANLTDKERSKINAQYINAGQSDALILMDEQQAHYAEGILGNEKILERLLAEKPTLKDRILDFFRTVKHGDEKLDGAARRLYRHYKKLFDQFFARNQGNNAFGGGAISPGPKYAIKYPTFSAEQIDSNISVLADMDAVALIDARKLEKTGKAPSAIFDEYFASLGNSIYSDAFGDIALGRSSVKSEIRHGITATKIASIEAIPSVIEQGKVIFHEKKDGGVERIVVCAPIKIGDGNYYMGVMLQRDAQTQYLYLHNVAIEKEMTNFSQTHLLTTGVGKKNEHLFITNILQKAIDVKLKRKKSTKDSSVVDDGTRRSLPEHTIDDAKKARSEGKISDVRYSLQFSDQIAENQRKFIQKHDDHITPAELNRAIDDTARMVRLMIQHRDILPEDRVGKTLVKNGSYDYSVENTTICVRTLAYNAFVDMVSEKIGRPLSQMESFLVSQKLYDIAREPQCLYCYVSLDRKAYNDMILRYIEQRDGAMQAYRDAGRPKVTRDSQLYKNFLGMRKDTDDAWMRYQSWISIENSGGSFLSASDVATEAKRASLSRGTKTQQSQIKDMLKYAQSASWAKKQTQYVAYFDDILRLSNRVIKNLNEHYGLRWYSFSDYSGAFIVENMQQITDASIRGLKGLAYTKDTDFVKIFAPTGMNINISVYAKKVDGKYQIDPLQSANIDEAIELRKQYPNVGIVVVATDTEGVEWALAQEWSDVVIPFHTVRTGAQVAEFYDWTIFNAEQSDTIADQNLWDAYVDSVVPNASANARKKVSKMVYPSEHQNSRETYLRLIEERGLKPRFESFLDNPNYMKLVNETRQSEAETVALKPVYNVDAAIAAFQKFVDKGGYYEGWYNDGIDVQSEAETVARDIRAGKRANQVSYGRQDIDVETIQRGRQSKREHGRRYALPSVDGEGVELTTEQREFFADSKVRDSQGRLQPMYHGTPTGGFTEFALPHYLSTLTSAQGAGYYFTDAANARQYMRGHNGKRTTNPQLYRVYLNITNPLEITEYSTGAISDEAFREIASRGNYQWGREHTDIDHILSRNTLDSDRLAELVRVFNGEEILSVMGEVLGHDGVRYTDQYGDIWVAWDKSQIKDTTNQSPTTHTDIRYALPAVDPVVPSSDKWTPTIDTQEAMRRFPDLWNVTAEESDTRNPTQIKGTVTTYRKIYARLKSEGFDGTILDASSGLGYGTRTGIEDFGFSVDDIEPYPDKSYNPKYRDYSKLTKQYDVIISNAVLNVLPQDQRDALVVKMGQLLREGGRLYVNVRGDDVNTLASNPNNVRINDMEWYVSSTGSYQKGFTRAELVAYLQDALGDGFSVEPVSFFGKASAIVTKVREDRQNGDIRYALSDTRGSVMTEVDQSYKPNVSDRVFSGWTAGQIAFTNAQAGIETIGKKYGVDNIEALVQMVRAGNSQAEEMISGNQYRIGADGKVYQGEGLEKIFRDIAAQGETVKGDFFDYLFHYHNTSRMSLEQRSMSEQNARLETIKKSKATLQELSTKARTLQDQIDALGRSKKDMASKRSLRAKLADAKKEAAALRKQVRELEQEAKSFVLLENKPVFGTTDDSGVKTAVTAEQSESVIKKYEEKYPDFKATAEKVWAFLRNLNQYRVDTGLIGQDTFDYLAELYPYYVPTYRSGSKKGIGAIEGKYNLRVKATVKKATGSMRELLPPDVMIARQVMETVRAGRINQLANALYDGALEAGDDTYIEIVTRERASSEMLADLDPTELRPKNNEIVFFRDGERLTMRVSKEIFAGFNAFNPEAEISNPLMNFARGVNNLFKRLVTSLNPTFLVRNTIRDVQDAGINTKYGKTFLKNYARASYEISHNGKYWQLYRAMGGFSSSLFDFEKGYSGKQNKWGLTKAEGNLLKRSLTGIENANAFVEQLPRLAEFISSIEAGNTAEQALLDSADVTTNFGRTGNITKVFNRTLIPFLNPSIQGFSKMIRNVTSIRSAKEFASLLVKVAIVGLTPQILNMLMYGDDEDYEELRDNDKENNFLFKVGDTFIKVPKGRVSSVLAGLVNRGSKAVQGEDVDWGGYVENIMQQVTPVDSMSRTIFSPFADVQNNVTWYGSAIEGRQFENVAPKDRYDESTSSIAIAIGQAINYSPKKIHYLLDQYSGVIGDFILPATTAKAEKDFISGNFTIDPATSNKLSTEFYEAYDQAQYAKSAGDTTAAFQVRYLNKVKSAVSEMYAEKSAIQNNSELSNADKLQQTRVIQILINEAYKTAIQDYELFTNAIEATASIEDANLRYIEATRLVYGAERALSDYNADVYAKCQTLNKAGIDYELLYNYYFTTKDIESDKDKAGNTISGSKRKKVVAAIKGMKQVSIEQKLLLICASGYSLQDNDIARLSATTARKRLLRYILGLKGVTQAEKCSLAEMCGFEVKNGKIVSKTAFSLQ